MVNNYRKQFDEHFQTAVIINLLKDKLNKVQRNELSNTLDSRMVF